jgi:hypothetical protein
VSAVSITIVTTKLHNCSGQVEAIVLDALSRVVEIDVLRHLPWVEDEAAVGALALVAGVAWVGRLGGRGVRRLGLQQGGGQDWGRRHGAHRSWAGLILQGVVTVQLGSAARPTDHRRAWGERGGR